MRAIRIVGARLAVLLGVTDGGRGVRVHVRVISVISSLQFVVGGYSVILSAMPFRMMETTQKISRSSGVFDMFCALAAHSSDSLRIASLVFIFASLLLFQFLHKTFRHGSGLGQKSPCSERFCIIRLQRTDSEDAVFVSPLLTAYQGETHAIKARGARQPLPVPQGAFP